TQPATGETYPKSDLFNKAQRVTNAAMLLFGGRKQDALNWLNMPVKGLGNVASVSLLTTEDGVQAVIDLIGQLEYGVFS
ncbi:hypothetical protein DJ490_23930, partial [Enterobacter hormaechei]|uniref:antitoxin Xre/MbcA/ParS toxin-binding domain-containing protein n=1 Tax=Enterobacter hormaechei TaxID=158836 RepID=UPI0011E3EF63